MNFETWLQWYKNILHSFGFKRSDDEKSAEYLNDFLERHPQNRMKIEDLPHKQDIIVFGAGPSIKKHILYLKETKQIKNSLLISADGATTALLEEDLMPDIVVTDLDGKLGDLLKVNQLKSIMVIHAHGNNLHLLKSNLNKLNHIMGTTQSIPLKNVYNFGGFTDGDRAVFLAVELGAENIILAGMDFGTIVTKYSRPNLKEDLNVADDIKKLKLEYAQELVDWIEENETVNMVNLINEEV